jgi:nicotinate-nucleotide adenylyltransferase
MPAMTRKIGVFAGTFDPVHAGHVAFALAARQAGALEEVIFVPEEAPRGKQSVTDITHRMVLLEIATSAQPQLRVARLDSPQFTIKNTLPELRRIGQGSKLVFLIGSDVACHLHTWEGVAQLLSETELAIGLRDRDSSQEIHHVIRQLQSTYGIAVQYRLIGTSHAQVTSSQIRRNISSTLLHPEALAYIQRHRLYLRAKHY